MLFAAAFISNTACSQNSNKMPVDKVPTAVITAFNAKFPAAAKIGWEMENQTEYEAVFRLNRHEVSANFDKDGNWLSTETEIEKSELPAAVQAALKAGFGDYKIEEAYKIESVKEGISYEVEIEKGKETLEVVFSPDGQVLGKKAVDEEKD